MVFSGSSFWPMSDHGKTYIVITCHNFWIVRDKRIHLQAYSANKTLSYDTKVNYLVNLTVTFILQMYVISNSCFGIVVGGIRVSQIHLVYIDEIMYIIMWISDTRSSFMSKFRIRYNCPICIIWHN